MSIVAAETPPGLKVCPEECPWNVCSFLPLAASHRIAACPWSR